MYDSKGKFLAITLMFVSLILDGFIASYWAMNLDTSFGLMIPRIIFLVFILLSFHYEKNFMLASAFVFGTLMDTYYLGFFGIYIVSFILIVYTTGIFKGMLQPNVMTYTMLSVIILTIVENFIYGVVRLLGITGISLQEFLVTKLAATLLFNSVTMLLMSYFIHRLVFKILDKN